MVLIRYHTRFLLNIILQLRYVRYLRLAELSLCSFLN